MNAMPWYWRLYYRHIGWRLVRRKVAEPTGTQQARPVSAKRP